MQTKTQEQRLSLTVWGLDWEKHLPMSLGDYTLEASTFEEFVAIKNRPNSFIISSENSNDQFLKESLNISKEEYLRKFSDFFVIRSLQTQEVCGVIVCDVMDWSSYYLRFIYIDPKHRSHNLTIQFVAAVESVLKNYSLDKIVCEVSSGNLPQVARMSQQGYICTGNSLSERFGSLLRLTKFLKSDSLEIFNTQFTQDIRHHKRSDEMTSSRN